MKVKLTPLNIVSSILIVGIAYFLLFPDKNGWRFLGAVSMFTIAGLTFVTDLLFRRTIKDLKRIWIIELAFIIFVAILILIFSR